MRRSLYADERRKIGRYWAVSLDGNDTLLVSTKGWIWIADKAGDRLGVAFVDLKGVEKISYHDFNDLGKQLMRIGGYITLPRQVELANNPNLRHPA